MDDCADAAAARSLVSFKRWLPGFVASLLSLGSSVSSAAQGAQAQQGREQLVQRFCGASELTSGPEVDAIRRIKGRFGPIVARDKGHRIFVAMIPSNEINAYHQPMNMRDSVICVPSVMAHFMGGDGELAFILGHEVGHAMDDICKTAEGRAQMATRMSPLAALRGMLLNDTNPNRVSAKVS